MNARTIAAWEAAIHSPISWGAGEMDQRGVLLEVRARHLDGHLVARGRVLLDSGFITWVDLDGVALPDN